MIKKCEKCGLVANVTEKKEPVNVVNFDCLGNYIKTVPYPQAAFGA